MVRNAPQIEIYSKALAALARSADPHLESLRNALSAPDADSRRPAAHDELDVMVTTPSGTRETAYTALYREGFLFIDLDRVGITRFTADGIDAHQQLLSAYESIAILRSRAVSMKQCKLALMSRYAEFTEAVGSVDPLGMVLAFDRVMLTCVAAIANERLMKTYASLACVAYSYACASRLAESALSAFASDVARFYELHQSGEMVAAARLVADIRAGEFGRGL
jgi:hypothetical protein